MPQRFTVPQFIDVEDKILGPITVRQFVLMLAAGVLAFIGYKLFDFGLFVIWAAGCFGITGVIAFLKINGMPFHFFLLNMFETLRRAPIRVWNKNLSAAQIKALVASKEEVKEKKEVLPSKAPLSFSSLSELALIADTGGSYEGERILESHQVSAVGKKRSPQNQEKPF